MVSKNKIETVLKELLEGRAKWAPGVTNLGWTVRVEDGNLRFNNKLNTVYAKALTQKAKEILTDSGYIVAHVSATMLLIDDK